LKRTFARYGVQVEQIGVVNDKPRLNVTIGGLQFEVPVGRIQDAWLNGLARVLR